jgi:gamma-butyrobetaine dioxygenase
MDNLQTLSAQLVRHLCECEACRDPRNGQRLTAIGQLDPALEITSVEPGEGRDSFVLSDGHRVSVSHARIDQHLGGVKPLDYRSESTKEMWLVADVTTEPLHWPEIVALDSVRLQMLEQLVVNGFARLTDVPAVPGAVLDVIGAFGYVRETNYGKIFEVRVENDPNNLAFTGLAIPPHTDNPYRDPVPTIQLLHCLKSEAAGGDSGLVDGFWAAAKLREINPDAFDILSGTLFHFEYRSADAYLSTLAPIISVNAEGEIKEIRWNDRSMQSPLWAAEANECFDAMRAFAELLNDPAAELTFKLNPGDCMVFDNTRVLHSRTTFDAAGSRHLQGAYADLDSAISEFVILSERLK